MSIPRKIHALLSPSERKTAVLLLGLMAIGMVLETLGIGFVVPAIALLTHAELVDQYPILQSTFRIFGNPSQVQLVWVGMLMLVGLYLIKTLFLAFLAWRQTKFAFGVQAHVSQRLFTTYLRQPYTFHLERNSAQLIRNATTEVTLFTGVLLDVLLLTTEGLVLLGLAVLLLIIEPVGAAIVVPVLGAAGWVSYRITRTRTARWATARQRHEGLRIQHLQQGLGGAKDAKLLGRERNFLSEYWVHNSECARVQQRQQTLLQLPRLWMELLAVVGLATIVLAMISRGRDVASIVPTLGLFAAAAFRLTPSVNRVLNGVQSLRFGLPVINILHEELGLPAAELVSNGQRTVPFQTEIKLSNISYTYPSAPASALNGLSLTIHKNEAVGLIGPSGSGKTTLVDVILGLLTPTGGEVTVDGQDIQQNVRDWQDQIGYVSQTIFLTDDSLRRNVAFGLPNEQIDDAAVNHAIKAAQLEEFVESLPDGLETLVGERGVRLSGGERQRIGIARALYHDPAVFVLDEATSALDIATERGVMEAVAALQGSRTIVIVAHRLSTVERCDRIYRLEQGRIVASGATPEVLRGSHAV